MRGIRNTNNTNHFEKRSYVIDATCTCTDHTPVISQMLPFVPIQVFSKYYYIDLNASTFAKWTKITDFLSCHSYILCSQFV